MKIYVGNLSFDTTAEQLQQEFERFGTVESVVIPTDKYSGKSRGFGFVEMYTTDSAQQAIHELNSRELNGRNLTVNEARPRNEYAGGRR